MTALDLLPIPAHVDRANVVGIDLSNGRIVVRNEYMEPGTAFGLTLCCAAYDKGSMDGVVCRSCYDTYDTGVYYFGFDVEGSYPEVERVDVDQPTP